MGTGVASVGLLSKFGGEEFGSKLPPIGDAPFGAQLIDASTASDSTILDTLFIGVLLSRWYRRSLFLVHEMAHWEMNSSSWKLENQNTEVNEIIKICCSCAGNSMVQIF